MELRLLLVPTEELVCELVAYRLGEASWCPVDVPTSIGHDERASLWLRCMSAWAKAAGGQPACRRLLLAPTEKLGGDSQLYRPIKEKPKGPIRQNQQAQQTTNQSTNAPNQPIKQPINQPTTKHTTHPPGTGPGRGRAFPRRARRQVRRETPR